MLAIIGKALIGALIGYGVCVALAILLLQLFSSNSHDRSQMAVMSAFFAFGPAGAVLGLIGGAVYGWLHS